MQTPPTPDTLQRYHGFTSHGGAYHSDDVRRILADAHAHYEAQIRPLAGLARPDAGNVPHVLGDARIDAMASAGKVALLTARIDALVEAMRAAARTLEGAHLGDGQEVAYVVAKGLRKAAQ